MNKEQLEHLTNIEISKKIAEIMGYKIISVNVNFDSILINRAVCRYAESFDPQDRGENCELRDYFEVEIDYDRKYIRLLARSIHRPFKNRRDIKRQVCLAIIEGSLL